MKKALLTAACLICVSGIAAAGAQDWRDLEKTHKHIQEAIHEMEHARAANHYDMQGHGAKAEQLLRDAEHELQLAVEAARKG